MSHATYDKIIIGAGLYGLYAAVTCAKAGQRVLVLEFDPEAFSRATYINQARVHMGYHYPRSYTTAIKSAGYYDRFKSDFGFAVKEDFRKIYAVARQFSWTDDKQFRKFCHDAGIPCDPVNVSEYFREELVEGAYLSRESTYDAHVLRDHFLGEVGRWGIPVRYGVRIETITSEGGQYHITTGDGTSCSAPFVLNATYASLNQILEKAGHTQVEIKYELCEVILCRVDGLLENIGITLMDGPFFSLMPFGKTGLHSLTSVTHTPHKTSREALPVFDCQPRSGGYCSPAQLGNCNDCIARPQTAWPFMSAMARKYLRPDIDLRYEKSLFSIKPVLKSSEVDDSRPTVIRQSSENPTFVSVLSGKINTIYDLNPLLLADATQQ